MAIAMEVTTTLHFANGIWVIAVFKLVGLEVGINHSNVAIVATIAWIQE